MIIREQMENINNGALCNYYGSLDHSIKPKYGVSLFIMDEYIARTMERETERARKQLHEINEGFRRSGEKQAKDINASIKKISDEVKEIMKLLKCIVKENDLKFPKKPEEGKKNDNSK